MSQKNVPAAAMPGRPERWRVEVGEAATARLEIPPDARRERLFEIAISMLVRARDDAPQPWHEMRIFADGELQWARRCVTQQPAEYDGLDYRFRRHIAVGRTLRLQVHSECGGGRRLKMRIEAEEV
jgi:hypothetical protein